MSYNQSKHKHIATHSHPDMWVYVWSVGTKGIACPLPLDHKAGGVQFVKNFDARINRGADKSLALPNSQCIFFDDENISFDASLVIYINSTNIPPIMIINRIYETQNLSL